MNSSRQIYKGCYVAKVLKARPTLSCKLFSYLVSFSQVEHAVYSSAVEENSALMQIILKWNQTGKGKKLTQNKSRGLVSPLEKLDHFILHKCFIFIYGPTLNLVM